MNNFTKTKLLSILCFVLTLGLVNAQNTPVAKNGQLKVCGTKLCNQYNNPIQLRGMSTHGIQWYGWGDCLTEASLDAMAYDWGADVLRISLYVQEGGYETNPTFFTNQVHTLINEATERGMYALVDWHQLTPGDPNYNLSRAKTFFTDIANAHKNKNNIIYDICNEPNGVSWGAIKTYADQIIPVIRAIDSDAVVLIGTHGWGSLGISDGRTAQDIVNNPVNIPNIMYTFHFYAASHGDRYLQELDWASDRLPIFVTEFGTQTASGDGTNNFTMSQRYIDLMRTKKISWANWNYSDDSRSGAVWTSGTCSAGPWNTTRLKPAGVWIRERMLTPADDFPGGGNILPSVSITSPSNNASFTAPASISIAANATDSDGNVTKVEFYNGTTKLGEDLTLPYTLTWNNVTAGSYTITAKATDNSGGSTTSTAVNVTVSNPVTQSPYNTTGTPWPIPGKVEAENFDNGGQNVAFNESTSGNSGNSYRTNENVDIEPTSDAGAGFNVGWVTAGEWLEYTVDVKEAANYRIEFRLASTSAGNTLRLEMDGSTISGTVTCPNTGAWQTYQTVSVTNAPLTAGQKVMRVFFIGANINLNYVNFVKLGTDTNTPPTVSLTSPSNGATFTAPATISIAATASDNVSVAKVEFFNGATKLGEDLTSPYTLTWNSVAVGSYTITAKATDNEGASTTSGAVTVTVTNPTNQLPTVAITSPSNGATFTAPATVSIAASASDDGGVSKVEFFNGSTKLGEDLSSPYTYSWTNVAAGSYTITAKATDNLGATKTSTAVTITVNQGGGCTAPQYIENGGYVAGSRVKNAGSQFECKPWPYSGWCNGAAWAYAPGTGAYWQDAWTIVGPCAKAGVMDATALKAIEIYPNPTAQVSLVKLNALVSTAEVVVVNSLGTEVYRTSLTNNEGTIDLAGMEKGIYVIRIIGDGNTWTEKLVKE